MLVILQILISFHPFFMPLAGLPSFTAVHSLATQIRNGGIQGWDIGRKSAKKLVVDLLTIGDHISGLCNGLNNGEFMKVLKKKYNLIPNNPPSHHLPVGNFLNRDDLTDPRSSDPNFRDLPSTFDLRSMDITVISLMISTGEYNNTAGIPSRAMFNKLFQTEISRETWDAAVEHSNSDLNDRPHLYKKNGRKGAGIDDVKILKVLIENKFLVKVQGRKLREKLQVYELVPGMTVKKAKEEVAKRLNCEPHLVNYYWPSSVIKTFACSDKKCKYCLNRDKIRNQIFSEFGIDLDPLHLSHRYYGFEKVEKTRIWDEDKNRYRYLYVGEKERLRHLLDLLAICDWHYSRNVKQRKWWSEKIEDIPLDSLFIQVDFMSTIWYQQDVGEKDATCEDGTSPFGMTLRFRDPTDGQTKMIHRVLFPNVLHSNAWVFKQCIKEVLSNPRDVLVQEIMNRTRKLFVTTPSVTLFLKVFNLSYHETMNDKASYCTGRECALYMVLDIKHDFPKLRESHLVPRETRHSVMDIDRHFGTLRRVIRDASKVKAMQNRGCIKRAWMKHVHDQNTNTGNRHQKYFTEKENGNLFS